MSHLARFTFAVWVFTVIIGGYLGGILFANHFFGPGIAVQVAFLPLYLIVGVFLIWVIWGATE